MRLTRSAPALLIALVLVGCAQQAPRSSTNAPTPSSSTAPTPAPTVRSGGRSLVFAGFSPFAGSMTPGKDSRELVLQITQLPHGGAVPACVGVHWRPLVQETAKTVTVTLVGYAPTDSGQCIDGLDEAVPFAVTLSAPLGARRLIDGSTRSERAVFDASTMPLPSAAALPSDVEAEPVRWDEKTGVAMKRWQSADADAAGPRDVWMSVGPEQGIAAGAPVPSRSARRVVIGDSAGRMWHGGGPYDVVVIRFQRGPSVVEVRTVQDKTSRGAAAVALRIARSLR